MFSCERLITLREGKGLSRSDLHRALVRLGFERCRALINRWETGASVPSANELALIAAALGVPVDRFFDSPAGAAA